MDASRFDILARLLAARQSRRRALGGAGLAAGALAAAGLGRATTHAQDATPPAGADEGPTFLFVQAFQRGSVAPKEAGAEGRYTLTLDGGLGQTVYFSDRPERIVGATPTPAFLESLGFPEENPPNAALVVEKEGGETEVAVVELFSPAYDEAAHTATYEVAVLEKWEDALEVGLTQTPNDLAAFGDSFGAAHLFIDGCPNKGVNCYNTCDSNWLVGGFNVPSCGFSCDTPCSGWGAVTQTCETSFGLDRTCVKAAWQS